MVSFERSPSIHCHLDASEASLMSSGILKVKFTLELQNQEGRLLLVLVLNEIHP